MYNDKTEDDRHSSLPVRIDKAMSAGNIAWWELTLPEGFVHCSDRKASMLGYDPAEYRNCHYRKFMDLVHPDDREPTMQAMNDHIEGLAEFYEAEYRILAADGTYHWYLDRGCIVRRETGHDEQPDASRITIMGVVVDITELKRRENELNAIGGFNNFILSNITDAVLLFDTNEILEYANSAVSRLIGVRPAEIIGRHWKEWIDPSVWSQISQAFQAVHETETLRYELENPIGNVGIDTVFLVQSTLVDGPDGYPRVLVVATDITEQKHRERQLEKDSHEDPVSLLANRRRFLQEFSNTLDNGRAGTCAVAFIDLNEFKSVNDTFGHAIGDDLLRETGRRIVLNIRRHDLAARYGGDEFVVLLRSIQTKNEIHPVVSRILRNLNEPYFINGTQLDVSVSLGVAVYPLDAHDPEQLIRIADERMYVQKTRAKPPDSYP